MKKLACFFTGCALLLGMIPLNASAVPELLINTEKFSFYDSGWLEIKDKSMVPELASESQVKRFGYVSGYQYHEENDKICYYITCIEKKDDGILEAHLAETFLKTHDLKLGDFLVFENWNMRQSDPGYFERSFNEPVGENIPEEMQISKIRFLGTGEEIFGEDFSEVLRWSNALICLQLHGNGFAADDLHIYGDVDRDGELTILDVICINKYLLGLEELNRYSYFLADVSGDTVVDATDSLLILKEVVELTKNFSET